MAQQLTTQPGHDAVGGAVGRQVARPTHGGAGQDGQADEDDGGHHVAQRGVVQQGALHDVGERDGLHDDEGSAQRRHGECDARDPSQTGDPGRQLRVDQTGPPRAGGWCAHRLNVVSFTSTARPMRPSTTARRAVYASSQVAAVRTPSGRSATMAVRTGSSPEVPP